MMIAYAERPERSPAAAACVSRLLQVRIPRLRAVVLGDVRAGER